MAHISTELHPAKLWRALKNVAAELGVALFSTSVFYIFFAIEVLHGRTELNDLVLAGTCLVTAVLAMNGLARLNLMLHPVHDHIIDPFVDHPELKHIARPIKMLFGFFHWIAAEAELTGIAVGMLMAGPLLWHRNVIQSFNGGDWLHLGAMAATLLGIMSMANILVNHMTPLLGLIEKGSRRLLGERAGGWLGVRLALAFGALLSSLTGEPAAAVFKLNYFKSRVKKNAQADAAVGFAMTIGSGGGLSFFAAPPILIIWSAYLAGTLGWDLGTLFLYIGGGCIAYVLVSAHVLAKHIRKPKTSELIAPTIQNWFGMIPMALIILPHILFYKHLPTWVIGLDLLTAIIATVIARKRFKDAHHEEKFTAMWQPWILALLLVMLEMIGLVGDPLIMSLGGLIPLTLPLPVIGFLLFLLTAWVSHFADNALASRVFIAIPIALLPTLGQNGANFLAIAVVTGALFGSLLTVSANLPNFYIKRALGVDPGAWLKSGLKYYWTGLVYVAWLAIAWIAFI